MLNIHIKIEAKFRNQHMMAVAQKQEFLRPVEFIEGCYKAFEKIHGLEYRVIKQASKDRK